MIARKLVLLMVLCCAGRWAPAEEISVAVASNFTLVMRDIVAEFERSSAYQVKLSYGSSGKFYAQIRHGAPFQVFFSADQAKPKALQRDGLIVPGSRFTYATGALVLWSTKPGLVDENATRLKRGDFNRLAMANPRLAPYGMAAVEVLENLGLKEATRAKWVQGENIAQTYQFVSSASVDMGFVALSQIIHRAHVERGSRWIIPTELYNPIRQDAVLLQRGADSAAAQALLRFVRGEKARDIIESYGYETSSAYTGS